MVAIIVLSSILAGASVGGLLNRRSAWPMSEDVLAGGLLGLILGGVASGVVETYVHVPII